MPNCPSCAEKVSSKDVKCPFCGERLTSGKSASRRSNQGTSGVIIAVIAVFAFGGLLVCGSVMVALLLPAVQQAREAARRTQCKNNLKLIGLAIYNYESTFNLLPAAHLNDELDQPRLSWRVSLMPYIDEAPRFNRYQFNEAWDSPLNSALLPPLPRTYACPSHSKAGSTNTSYATIVGDHSALGDGTCFKLIDITDGSSNTILVVEACKLEIPWMKPQDIDANTVTRVGDPNGISSDHVGGVHVLLGDGTVRYISNNVDPKILKALITKDGGEPVGDF